MIPVKPKTKEQLKNLGRKGETYDSLLIKIMESYERNEMLETHYKRLAEKKEFVDLSEL